MAIVMVAGLMWPHRRSLGSVVRKVSVLVLVLGGYLGVQMLNGTGFAYVLHDPKSWVEMPMRSLRLATLMMLPVLQDSPLLAHGGSLVVRSVALLEQVRPVLGILLLGLCVLWFLRGSGAVRWLLASYLAFLLPFGLIELPGTWLDIRYAYLPSTCFCGLLAYGFRALWLRNRWELKTLLALVLLAVTFADVTLVRRLEAKYDDFGRSPESQTRMRQLQDKFSKTL